MYKDKKQITNVQLFFLNTYVRVKRIELRISDENLMPYNNTLY